jgi:TolB-like protein
MKKNHFIFSQMCKALLCCLAINYCTHAVAGNSPTVAELALCTGDIQISKLDKAAQVQGVLAQGDTLRTADKPDSRCRLAFPNGNTVDIGPASTVKFDNDQEFTLMQGQLVAFAMPTLGKQEHAMRLHIDKGFLALAMGKIFATVNDKPQIAVFNDLVSAVWRDNQGEKILYPGNLVSLSSGAVEITQAARDMEAKVSVQMSPEQPAVAKATQAYKNKDVVTAARLFRQIQQAFPYNAAAAYHLGVLDLNANKAEQAAQQWQKYKEIDPDGAQKRGVTKQLSLVTTKAIQDEVKNAIANEKSISNLAPEPNSIAVHPLINKGAEQYAPIGKGLAAFVISDLSKIPGLKVLEREKLQKLIDEIKLSETGLTDETSSRVRAGKIMRAEKLMIGDYLIENNKGGQ